MANSNAYEGEDAPASILPQTISAAQEIERLSDATLEHALDARKKGLKVYESLKSLNDVIGTQYGERVLFELLKRKRCQGQFGWQDDPPMGRGAAS